jgi:hypothetical protein
VSKSPHRAGPPRKYIKSGKFSKLQRQEAAGLHSAPQPPDAQAPCHPVTQSPAHVSEAHRQTQNEIKKRPYNKTGLFSKKHAAGGDPSQAARRQLSRPLDSCDVSSRNRHSSSLVFSPKFGVGSPLIPISSSNSINSSPSRAADASQSSGGESNAAVLGSLPSSDGDCFVGEVVRLGDGTDDAVTSSVADPPQSGTQVLSCIKNPPSSSLPEASRSPDVGDLVQSSLNASAAETSSLALTPEASSSALSVSAPTAGAAAPSPPGAIVSNASAVPAAPSSLASNGLFGCAIKRVKPSTTATLPPATTT